MRATLQKLGGEMSFSPDLLPILLLRVLADWLCYKFKIIDAISCAIFFILAICLISEGNAERLGGVVILIFNSVYVYFRFYKKKKPEKSIKNRH
jgi:hypothetical protein